MDQYPDEYLPRKVWGLAEFNSSARLLLSQGSAGVEDFVRLVMAGRIINHDEEEPSRIFIDAKIDADRATDIPLTCVRDFDSLIGTSRDLPFTESLSIFPVPRFGDTMTKDNHLTYPIRLPGWQHSRQIGLHRIPNLCLGKINIRQKTLLFFPKLYTTERFSPVSQEDIELLYDDCIRSALLRCVPEHMSHWPINYQMALVQSRDTRGQMHFGSIDLPPDVLPTFTALLMQNLARHDQFQDSFFCHEWRGLKGSTAHDPDDGNACDQAMNYTFRALKMDQLMLDDWWIDVGLEVYSPGKVLQWLEESHGTILGWTLPSVPRSGLRDIIDSKSFNVDVASHLYQLAGFRATVWASGRADGVNYINVYTTDKSGTYQLHTGSYRRHRPSEIEPVKIKSLLEDIRKLAALYNTSCGDAEHEAQEGCCRLEVRIKINKATEKLRDMTDDILDDCIVGIDTRTWWEFKFLRLVALNYVLDAFSSSSPKIRVQRPVLRMGAIAVHMLNALIYRPGAQRWDQLLEDSCVSYGGEDEDEEYHDGEETYPYKENRGAYFLSDVAVARTAYRLPLARELSGVEMARVFNMTSWPLVQAIFLSKFVPRSRVGNNLGRPKRLRIRRHRTTALVDEDTNTTPIVHDFGLEDADIQLRHDVVLEGRDVVNHTPEVDNLDARVSSIWNQMASDILQVSPNRRAALHPPYCTLSLLERQAADEDLFKQPVLPFDTVQIKPVSIQTWDTILFAHYFPSTPPLEDISAPQNFGMCSYYKLWFGLLSDLSPENITTVRQSVLARWQNLLWIPYSASDRMWNTRSTRSHRLPLDAKGAAPQVAVNERNSVDIGEFRLKVQEGK